MKRIRIIQIIGIVLFVIYFGLFVVDLSYGILHDLNTFVFSIILALISISLLFKGVLLKSSSTLWFAINLIFSAIFLIIINLFNLNIDYCYYIFSLIPLVASLINLLIYRYIIYIKVIVLNISIIIPVVLMQFFAVEWWIILVVAIVSVLLGIFICRSFNLGREKV